MSKAHSLRRSYAKGFIAAPVGNPEKMVTRKWSFCQVNCKLEPENRHPHQNRVVVCQGKTIDVAHKCALGILSSAVKICPQSVTFNYLEKAPNSLSMDQNIFCSSNSAFYKNYYFLQKDALLMPIIVLEMF